MNQYDDKKIEVGDGLSLAVRRYAGGSKTPVLCIPGLTRNASDFDDLAPRVAATGRDVITVSLRGRGRSDWDLDYLNYHPETYRNDVLTVLDALGVRQAVFVGTSLGGIVTMATHGSAPERIKAAVLNDIGPELAPEGIARIAGYVGAGAGPAASLKEAAARIRAINAVAFPDASDAEWLVFARRTFHEAAAGEWVLDYDPNIARALMELGPAPDLWPAFESLNAIPTLVLRGDLSDLLSPEIVDKMREAHPSFDYAEVPRIGHAPMMTEPVAWAALETFLLEID
jgi:pimeloyl-ACP methyl ester carboxylesterase